MKRWLAGAPVLGAVLLFGVACTAEQPKKDAYTDPREAGPDFRIQGEYAADQTGRGPYGVQVVARGDGKFDAYLLKGGLPGAGWDGKTRVKSMGVRKGDGDAAIEGDGWRGEIKDGKLAVKTKEGDSFTLTHVVRHSPTEGEKAPQGAVVLFDGKNADQWNGGKLVQGDLLQMGCTSKLK